MGEPLKIGGWRWNEHISSAKGSIKLLRADIEDLRVANQENAEVLDFLLVMSSRLDDIVEELNNIWEIGVLAKETRAGNNDE